MMGLFTERSSNQFQCRIAIEPELGKSRVQRSSSAITVKAMGRLLLQRKSGKKEVLAVGGTIRLRDNGGIYGLRCNGDRSFEIKFDRPIEPNHAKAKLIEGLIDKLCSNSQILSAERV